MEVAHLLLTVSSPVAKRAMMKTNKSRIHLKQKRGIIALIQSDFCLQRFLKFYFSHRISNEIDFARSARSEGRSDCPAPAVV